MNNAVVLDLNLTYKGTIFTIKDNIYFSLYEMLFIEYMERLYHREQKYSNLDNINFPYLYFFGENLRTKKIYTSFCLVFDISVYIEILYILFG